MIWTSLDTWIVVAGILSALSCALLGNFLVLRKMSMMGDAISHAVLPGLALAFLWTSSRSSLAMFIGAAIVGVLTALFTQWIHKLGKVEQGASMGVVFTALFALGLILIVRAADHVDLDPGCVLYGAIELVPLDTVNLSGWEVPRAVISLSVVLLIDLLFVILLYKELKISSFDEDLATTLGINASLMHYLLMTLVAVTTVAAFESVGSILVIAMLIVPAAAAHLLTDRLVPMITVSLILGALSAVLGHLGAITLPRLFGFADTSTAGMMAVAGGFLFLLAMLFAPRHGICSKVLHRSRLSFRILCEDILGLLYRMDEIQPAPARSFGPAELVHIMPNKPKRIQFALRSLRRSDRITPPGQPLALTDRGREEARKLVRSHRLWESYLFKHLQLPADHVHATAERLEHITTEAMQDELGETVGLPSHDPQGKKIP